MSAPKPEPSAWEWWCYRCGEIRCTSENRPDWEHVRDLGEHGCGTSGAPYGRAIWGHEWAAVAWMAAAVEIVIEEPRCSVTRGAQCCLARGHQDEHRYKCGSPTCPGLIYPASQLRHPPDCGKPAEMDELAGLPPF